MTHKIRLENTREDNSIESRELRLANRELEVQVRELKIQIREIETKTSFDIECLELENRQLKQQLEQFHSKYPLKDKLVEDHMNSLELVNLVDSQPFSQYSQVQPDNTYLPFNYPVIPKSNLIEISCVIKFVEKTLSIDVMIDTGASKSYIEQHVVLPGWSTALTTPALVSIADGTKQTYTHCINGAQISFHHLGSQDQHIEWFPLPQVWIGNTRQNHPFILGLNFILSLQGGMFISQHNISFFKRTVNTPTAYALSTIAHSSELRAKRGGTIGVDSVPASFLFPSRNIFPELAQTYIPNEIANTSLENLDIENYELEEFDFEEK